MEPQLKMKYYYVSFSTKDGEHHSLQYMGTNATEVRSNVKRYIGDRLTQ